MVGKLRIAQIAPFWYNVPPHNYGGTERIISYITEELVKRGHEVSLFASQHSKTKAQLISPVPYDLLKTIETYCDTNYNAINTYANSYAFLSADKFDIIHSHASYFSFYFCDFVKTPTLHTLHNQMPRPRAIENELFNKYKNLNYVSISDNFRKRFNLNYVATVYHGLDLNIFPFNEKGGESLFWMGRLSKNKGEAEAIQVALKTKKKLKLGISFRKETMEYYKQQIEPYTHTNMIQIMHDINFLETYTYYGDSKAFLFPLSWEEPFGLIMIESMASGTPVVAYAKGSVPEIIKDGITGFLINPSETDIRGEWIVKKTGIEGIQEAVERIYDLSAKRYLTMRLACRHHVEAKFTVNKMVDNYEKIYYSLLSNRLN